MARKVLIDTDPGIDDTMALLLALRSPELEVVGLTTVFGNTDVEVTAQNALRIVELEGNDHIPVAQGAGVPMVIPSRATGKRVHGADGMGNTNPPPPKGKLHQKPAAQFIVETVMANPGEITLVPVGPLTNIALALRLEPRLVTAVKEVVIMGGAANVPGNISPVAEANIHNDPHAANLVFGAGWKLSMIGLDVTTRATMTKDYIAKIASADTKAAKLIGAIMPHYQKFHDDLLGMGGSTHTHDPSAIAYLIAPGLFTVEHMPMYVEIEGRCSGATIPDRRKQWGDLSKPVDVCVGVDAGRMFDLIAERLSKKL